MYTVDFWALGLKMIKQSAALLQAMRPHQWVKNGLVFLPLVAAHQLTNGPLMLTVAAGAGLFSAMAAAIYLFNDYNDVEADQAHPTKRHRPIASGRLSPKIALSAGILLAAGALLGALGLNIQFAGLLMAYALVSMSYTLGLKRIAVVDVFALVSLYLLRIIAGAALAGIAASPWLLAFSLFLFFSLGLVKRQTELQRLSQTGGSSIPGRGWIVADTPLVRTLGVGAGLMAVLILALYIDSEQAQSLYAQPEWLWVACPLLLFWVSHVWRVTERGEMHDDPVVFALRDRVSVALGVLMLMAAYLAASGF